MVAKVRTTIKGLSAVVTLKALLAGAWGDLWGGVCCPAVYLQGL